MTRHAMIVAAAGLTLLLGACGQGASEKAGQDADSAYENATQGHENLSDGPMENAGEAVDDAAQGMAQEGERAADAIEDASKGEPTP